MRKNLMTLLTVLAILALFPTAVFAGTRSWSDGTNTITMTTPDSYSLCPADGASDSFTISGLPAGYILQGWAQTQYVNPGGSRTEYETYQIYYVSDGASDFVQTVNYPPLSSWVLTDEANGMYELHVDLAISVTDPNGLTVSWVGPGEAPGTLGPGNDWDVYCNEAPPPPPPPPPPGVGTGTRGYWANHAEAWPVSSIDIGGVTYTVDQAIANMVAGGRDKTYILFAQLVAAKLNVANGAESSCISGTIAAADAWFVSYPLGSGVAGGTDAWTEGSSLTSTLDAYNNGYMCAPHRD